MKFHNWQAVGGEGTGRHNEWYVLSFWIYVIPNKSYLHDFKTQRMRKLITSGGHICKYLAKFMKLHNWQVVGEEETGQHNKKYILYCHSEENWPPLGRPYLRVLGKVHETPQLTGCRRGGNWPARRAVHTCAAVCYSSPLIPFLKWLVVWLCGALALLQYIGFDRATVSIHFWQSYLYWFMAKITIFFQKV